MMWYANDKRKIELGIDLCNRNGEETKFLLVLKNVKSLEIFKPDEFRRFRWMFMDFTVDIIIT